MYVCMCITLSVYLVTMSADIDRSIRYDIENSIRYRYGFSLQTYCAISWQHNLAPFLVWKYWNPELLSL